MGGSAQKRKGTAEWRCLLPGGPKGIRTLDLSDANRTLSQLSYGPIFFRPGRRRILLYHSFLACKASFFVLATFFSCQFPEAIV